MQRIILFLASTILFSSCSNENVENTLTVFRSSAAALGRSNKMIASATEMYYRSLNDKLADTKYAEHAMIWQPKAMLIKKIAGEMNGYIDQLKKDLIEQATAKTAAGNSVFHDDNMDATARVFLVKEKSKELYGKLKQYKLDLLAVDPELMKKFRNSSFVLQSEFAEGDQHDRFTNTYFKMTPVIAALATLEMFENNVTIMEHDFVEYCYYQASSFAFGNTNKVEVIVSQSSSYVKAGDNIEIMAGVGSFSDQTNTKVTVDGKDIIVTGGEASYKLKTSATPGKYSVPVKVEYLNANGEKNSKTIAVNYTVAQ